MRSPLSSILLVVSLLACSGGGGGGGSKQPATPATSASSSASFEVAGSVAIAPGSAVDGDVGDAGAALRPNDTLATAQILVRPVHLGGYLNQPGAGPEGRSLALGDVRDYYRVELLAGDVIELSIHGDPARDDLDLSLLAPDGRVVLAAPESPLLERLVVPENGAYVIEATAFAGAARYTLRVASGVVPTETAGPEFVPGELVVRFDPDQLDGPMQERVASMGLEWSRGWPEDEMLLTAADAGQRDTAFYALGIDHLLDSDPLGRDLPMHEQLRRDTPRLAKALRRRADVETADPNYIRRPFAQPADVFYPLQWHYLQIGLPLAWDLVSPDSGVIVGVIDTGVVAEHPELAGQLVAGYDFISNPANAADGDGCDPDPGDPGDGLEPGTSSFHGTHVTGTVVARTSLQPLGDAEGVAGVAWNARVMPLRALGRAGGTDFDVMQAVRYAAGLDNQCGALPARPADVLNLSLGGPGRSASFEALVQEVRLAGLVIVAAAGNAADDTPLYPAAYPGVISVGAVDAQGVRAPYSSFGATLDVAAPGGDLAADLTADGYPDGVLSLFFDELRPQTPFAFSFAAGTSMAAPHVAGVVALMLGVHPGLTPADIDLLLSSGQITRDLGNPAFYGAGLIDARAAVQAALRARDEGVAMDAARLGVDPVELRFGPNLGEAGLVASNVGAPAAVLDLLAVTASTEDGTPWLAVEPLEVDAAGLGRYRMSVNRAGLGEGQYRGQLSFDSSANDVDVPVVLEVAAAPAPSSDGGRHHIALVDADSGERRYVTRVDATDGSYAFRFDAVEAGEYHLLAGSDLDGNGRICEPGEACGAYPQLADPARLSLGPARLDLDFTSAFRAPAELEALDPPDVSPEP